MQLVNTFDVGLKVSTFNVGDILEWIPFKMYYVAPYSRIYVQAHDHGRCKVRIDWNEFGGRELGPHSEEEVLVVRPPTPEPLPITGDPVFVRGDELGAWLRETLRDSPDLIRQYFFDLPGHHAPDHPLPSPE